MAGAQATASNAAAAGMSRMAGSTAALSSQMANMGGVVTANVVSPLSQIPTLVQKGDVSFKNLVRTQGKYGQLVRQQRGVLQGFIGTQANALGQGQAFVNMQHGMNTVAVTAMDRFRAFNATMGGFASHMVKVGKNVQWAGRQLMVGLTVPLAIAGGLAAKTAIDTERELIRLQKVYTTLGGTAAEEAQELRGLEDAIKDLADTTAESWGVMRNETIQAAAEFAAMGHRVEEQGGLLETMTSEALRMQKLGEIELSDAINLVRATQASWRLETEELIDTMNRFNAIENQTALRLDKIATALPEVSAALAEMGIAAEFGAGAMAAMVEGGIEANEAAMALRMLVTRMIDPSAAAKKRFEELNIPLERILENADNGEEIINGLGAAFSELTGDERIKALNKLVGVRQASRINIFFRQWEEGAEGANNAWTRALEVMDMSAEEVAANAATEMGRAMDSIPGQIDRAKAQIMAEIEDLGEGLMGGFLKVLQIVQKVIEWFNNIPSAVKNVIGVFAGFLAILGPIIMLVGLLGNAFGMILKTISFLLPGMELLTFEQRAQQIAFQSNTAAIQAQTAAINNLAAAQGGLTSQQAIMQQRAHAGTLPIVSSPLQPGGATTQPAGQGSRRSFGRFIGATVALAGLVGTIEELKKESTNWLSVLMNVGITAAMLKPIFGGMFKSLAASSGAAAGIGTAMKALGGILLGPVGAGIAAIAATLYIIKKRSDTIIDNVSTIKEESEGIAEAMDLAFQTSEDFEGSMKEGEGSARNLRLENQELVNELRQLKNESEEAFQDRVYQIAFELVQRGNSPEEVEAKLQAFFDRANISVDVQANLIMDEQQIRRSANMLGREIAGHLNRSWGARLGGATQPLEDLADMVNTALRGEGSLSEVAIYVDEAIQGIIQNTDSVREQGDAIRSLLDNLGELTGLDFSDVIVSLTNTSTNANISAEIFTKLRNEGVLTASELNNAFAALTTGAVMELEDQVESARENVETLRAAVQRGGSGTRFLKEELKDAEARLAELEKELGIYENTAQGAGVATDDLGESVEETGEKMKTAAEKARDLVNAFRGQVSELQGRVAQSVQNVFQRQRDAVMDSFSDQMEAIRDRYDEQRDAITETYDAEIERIKGVREQERELEREREEAFNAWQARLDYMAGAATSNIELRAALAGGETSRAAMIRVRLRTEEEKFYMEQSKKAREEASKTRDAEVDAKVDRLEAEKDTRLEELEVAREIEEEKVEIARKAAEEQYDIIADRIQGVLDKWKDINPQTEAEWREHLGQLKSDLGPFLGKDGSFDAIIRDFAARNSDDIYTSFGTAFDDALKEAQEEERWEGLGKTIAAKFGEGFTGGLKEIAAAMEQFLITGDVGALEEAIQNIMNSIKAGGGYTPGMYGGGVQEYHQGGFASGKSAPGLKSDEFPAVLQSGEYVMQRDAVKGLGVNFLESLNRMHGGGLVDFGKAMAMKFVGGLIEKMNLGGGTGQGAFMPSDVLGGGAGASFRRGGKWPPRTWGKITANTAAAQGFINQAWGSMIRSNFAGVHRGDPKSDHSYGKALDIMVTQPGTFASGDEQQVGSSIASWFVQNPSKYGTKYVIWNKQINSGSGWKPYTRYGDNPGPTLGHYDHVHLSFLHDGGLVPQLAKGAHVNYDNTLANLHRGETVLTSNLSESLQRGIRNMESGGGGDTYVTIEVNGANMDEKQLAKKVRFELDKMDRAKGGNRRI